MLPNLLASQIFVTIQIKLQTRGLPNLSSLQNKERSQRPWSSNILHDRFENFQGSSFKSNQSFHLRLALIKIGRCIRGSKQWYFGPSHFKTQSLVIEHQQKHVYKRQCRKTF